MELKYLALLTKHNLTVAQLPEDAAIGIDNINSTIRGMNMIEKGGKKITEKAFKKLAAQDKWVCYEIIDFVDGTDENTSVDDSNKITAEAQAELDRIAAEKKKTDDDAVAAKKKSDDEANAKKASDDAQATADAQKKADDEARVNAERESNGAFGNPLLRSMFGQ